MTQHYDVIVRKHYDQVAGRAGLSSSSTMEDKIVRAKETDAILRLVRVTYERSGTPGRHAAAAQLAILDVGCGNGYTLARVAEAFPRARCIGLEPNAKLRSLAKQQTRNLKHVKILNGDLRDISAFAVAPVSVDILISQRVLINILDAADQRRALENCISLVKTGGVLLFLESTVRGLTGLNDARAEFELEPIKPAFHNLYLPDGFFNQPALRELTATGLPPRNFLSTHYYVSRVLHDVMLRAAKLNGRFHRNSRFVQFLSAALADGVGDYAPLQLHCFRKEEPTRSRDARKIRSRNVDKR